MPRPRWSTAVGPLLFVGLGAASWVWLIVPSSEQYQWYRRVNEDLRLLDGMRPADIAPERWKCIVEWTRKLHGNCGPPGSNGDTAAERQWREEFAAELERRLAGPVTLADIDWVWDEYAAHTHLGQRYSDRYRPTRAEVCPP